LCISSALTNSVEEADLWGDKSLKTPIENESTTTLLASKKQEYSEYVEKEEKRLKVIIKRLKIDLKHQAKLFGDKTVEFNSIINNQNETIETLQCSLMEAEDRAKLLQAKMETLSTMLSTLGKNVQTIQRAVACHPPAFPKSSETPHTKLRDKEKENTKG